MPEGGVATGAGGTAGDNDNAELLLAGGVVLTVGAAGVLLIGRRNARD
jgi:LPXTG-motif cell wall-anchored protein